MSLWIKVGIVHTSSRAWASREVSLASANSAYLCKTLCLSSKLSCVLSSSEIRLVKTATCSSIPSRLAFCLSLYRFCARLFLLLPLLAASSPILQYSFQLDMICLSSAFCEADSWALASSLQVLLRPHKSVSSCLWSEISMASEVRFQWQADVNRVMASSLPYQGNR